MVEVILSGYNIDTNVIEDLKKGKFEGVITPETLSAAYARISRDPRPVDELRKDALSDVEKARKSNTAIVFGLGHASVSEHAVFNFDIKGLSRLAIEELEKARLCSYTEKSQRYITMDSVLENQEYTIPEGLSSSEESLFKEVVEKGFDVYTKALPVFFERQKTLNPDKTKKRDLNILEGLAKEDARYALCNAVHGQLGFTANARNLEKIITTLKFHPLAEVRELAFELHDRVKPIAPSLIREYPDTEDFVRTSRTTLGQISEDCLTGVLRESYPIAHQGDVRLVEHTFDPDSALVASILHANSKSSYGVCISRATEMESFEKVDFIKSALANLSKYDSLPREFEHVSFTFEADVSASAFAQWKRHRMMTLTKQGYGNSMNYTIPESFIDCGMVKDLYGVFGKSDLFYKMVGENNPEVAEYGLTNAHKRKILCTMNLRQLYAFSRLRGDVHAQWDIRRQAHDLCDIVKGIAPASGLLLEGKDGFDKLKESIYGGE